MFILTLLVIVTFLAKFFNSVNDSDGINYQIIFCLLIISLARLIGGVNVDGTAILKLRKAGGSLVIHTSIVMTRRRHNDYNTIITLTIGITRRVGVISALVVQIDQLVG